jgi:hypothetical protein
MQVYLAEHQNPAASVELFVLADLQLVCERYQGFAVHLCLRRESNAEQLSCFQLFLES